MPDIIEQPATPQRIYRRWQLPEFTGYSLERLDEKVAEGSFPSPIKLGARAVGWVEQDLLDWQRDLIEASREQTV